VVSGGSLEKILRDTSGYFGILRDTQVSQTETRLLLTGVFLFFKTGQSGNVGRLVQDFSVLEKLL
jgi:hypothetical protein